MVRFRANVAPKHLIVTGTDLPTTPRLTLGLGTAPLPVATCTIPMAWYTYMHLNFI